MDLWSPETAQSFDEKDELKEFRKQFFIPKKKDVGGNGDEDAIYLNGNSLGLMCQESDDNVQEEINKWKGVGVLGHGVGRVPWMKYEDYLNESTAELLNCDAREISNMNSLSVNLHLLLNMFYNPIGNRTKILIEQHAFGSDFVTVATHLSHRGFLPSEHLIEIKADPATFTTPVQSIFDTIEKHKSELSCILLGGVNFLTGEVFPMEEITKFAHSHQIRIIWDLAHAVGNIPLDLHRWGVDAAAWCTYKYLNAGPGAVGGMFVHQDHLNGTYSESEDGCHHPFPLQKHEENLSSAVHESVAGVSDKCTLKYLSGWWGHKSDTRFAMAHNYIPADGCKRFMMSTPPAFLNAVLLGSLNTLLRCGGMPALRCKGLNLAKYLEKLLTSDDYANSQLLKEYVEILTPLDDDSKRGCQLSLRVKEHNNVTAAAVFTSLTKQGVVCDFRRPLVIRVAPVAPYNTFSDCLQFAICLKNAIESAIQTGDKMATSVDPTPGKF